MRNKIQWYLNKALIIIPLFLLILMPTQVESFNSFYSAYDFKLPHNDVKYNQTGTASGSTKIISIPAMDIQEVKFHFNIDSFVTAEMIMGAKPYTNNTILYEFNLSFDINSTTKLVIVINNAVNPNNYHYTSVNQSLVNIAISTPNKLVIPFSYPIKPTILNNNITWIADLHEINTVVPLSKIFTKSSLSSQSKVPYQNNFIFKFEVKNSAYNIYDLYEINHLGTPPNYNLLIYGGIGVLIVVIVAYIIYRRRQKPM